MALWWGYRVDLEKRGGLKMGNEETFGLKRGGDKRKIFGFKFKNLEEVDILGTVWLQRKLKQKDKTLWD